MDFKTLKEQTAADCEQLAEDLKKLAAEVREGDIDAFLSFFIGGETEEEIASFFKYREMILLRYFKRAEDLKNSKEAPEGKRPETP